MNWKTIKEFNLLYLNGETSSDLLNIPHGRRILEMGYVNQSDKRTFIKTSLYDEYYREKMFDQFQLFKNLLEKYNLLETNFEDTELIALVSIENNKADIINRSKSQKEIATLYFNSAKYLKKGTKLFEAVLKILDTNSLAFDEHDQQFLYVLHCKSKKPKAIILCENDNQLRKPRLDEIELWFAGGRNTAKLKFIEEPSIPFYYLCDWDNRGIEIYQDIKKNIFPKIEIIVPEEPLKLQDIVSEWTLEIDYNLFSEKAKQLLLQLIPAKWIEEESINCSILK